ncbi:MAG: two-component sensor histidine kinase [Alphaproteobacteria bacterium]|nr:two-component sensor histidine kinase [Alphaproteobacteria bacterium]
MKKRFTIGLQAVFAVILLIVLLLPLSGVYFFRLFENELVRQTEAELIAQGVFMSALYKDALNGENIPLDYGRPVTEKPPVLDARFKPYPPTIDLRTATILPPRPDAVHPAHKPDPAALTAGRRLESVLQEAKFSTLASMRMLDFDGTVVAGAGEMTLSLSHTEEVARAMTGVYASGLRQRISDEPRPALASLSRGTDTRVFVAMPVVDNDRVLGIAYLSRSPRNVLKTLYDERESVFLAAVIALLMTGGIAWLLATMIGKPLRVLTRHAQAVSKGEARTENLPAPPIRELAALAESFAHMSATIEARSEYIRSFAMHVAHEFKTPLTAIQGAVELLNDHANDMEPEQRRRFMENITQDTGRLKILVSRLLELARADVLQAGGEFTDLQPLLESLAKRYAPKLEVEPPQGPWLAAIGPDILETVLVNLVENSLQHGATKVWIVAESAEDKMELIVRDNGQGISAGNAAKLFTPFFTTRREQGGTGLGLVITRSLLKAYGGDIMLADRTGGTTFKLTLKGH